MLVVFALHASVAMAADTWVALTPAEARMGFSALASDPVVPDTLYADAANARGVAKSTDGGRTWRILPAIHVFLVHKIIVERDEPNGVTVWASSDPSESVFRSDDAGTSWVQRELPLGGIWDLAVDPRNSSTLYAAYWRSCFGSQSCVPDSGGVYRSTDGGRKWTHVLKNASMNQVVADEFASGTVYAIGVIGERSYRSENRGETWQELGATDARGIFRIAPDPVIPDVLYASTYDSFWRSENRGESWTKLSELHHEGHYFAPAWTIAVDPAHRGVIALGGGDGRGVAISSDGGHTWLPVNNGLGVAVNQMQPAMIRIFFSSNGSLFGAASFHGVMTIVDWERRRPVRR